MLEYPCCDHVLQTHYQDHLLVNFFMINLNGNVPIESLFVHKIDVVTVFVSSRELVMGIQCECFFEVCGEVWLCIWGVVHVNILWREWEWVERLTVNIWSSCTPSLRVWWLSPRYEWYYRGILVFVFWRYIIPHTINFHTWEVKIIVYLMENNLWSLVRSLLEGENVSTSAENAQFQSKDEQALLQSMTTSSTTISMMLHWLCKHGKP